jgi:hypothetical protein
LFEAAGIRAHSSTQPERASDFRAFMLVAQVGAAGSQPKKRPIKCANMQMAMTNSNDPRTLIWSKRLRPFIGEPHGVELERPLDGGLPDDVAEKEY